MRNRVASWMQRNAFFILIVFNSMKHSAGNAVSPDQLQKLE